jgi:PHP family Zn ribbon phosphoesterase
MIVKMLCLNYDSRPIDNIADSLYFYKLIGKKIVKLNISNIRSGSSRLVDILQEHVDILGLGIGVGNDVSMYERKGVSLYNCLFVKHVIVHFSVQHSPPIPMPKNIDEFVLEFPFVTDSHSVSSYLHKVIVKECKPSLRLIHLDKVSSWDVFQLPPQIKVLICSQEENVPEFDERMGQLGFRKKVENLEYVFEKQDNA